MSKSSNSPTLRQWLGSTTCMGIAGLLALAAPQRAQAFNLYDGSDAGNNLEINLTTTVSYSAFLRVNSPSTILTGGPDADGNSPAANSNDGDANFRHGFVGNLFEAVPVLDIRDGNYGAHFSGQFYLNTPYLGTNQNNQAGTLNSIYLPKNTDFASGTRNVNGQNAQLLDAFLFAQHEFADGQSLQLKVGRQTLFWGQSLFFPTDGISGGQAPVNAITATSLPNPQSQQVFMPVGQVVFTYQPGIDHLTFQAYYQYEWEHDYFNGSGAYFNGGDYIDKGGNAVIAGYAPGLGNEYFLRIKDLNPEPENGQFGLSVQGNVDLIDWGLYGLRYDSKAPVVYAHPAAGIVAFVPGGASVGNYQVVYPRDIWLEGASFSTSVEDANVAGEISAREHAPLIPAGFGIPSAGNPGNANSDPLYPLGDVLDAQLSSLYVSPGIPLDPGGVQFDGEVAMNHVIAVTQNRSGLRPYGQATAAAFDFVLTPTYYNVLPNLQLTFPIGIDYNFLGRSEFDEGMQHGTGTFDLGVTGTYRSTWIASLTYQDYLGKPTVPGANTTYNDLADRGYVALNIQHSF